jgi:hypothetical protein
MIVVFVVLAMVVVGGTAAALAGRWRPEGLAEGRPDQIEAVPPDAAPRFDVVIRGYRMRQVDREMALLRAELVELRGQIVAPGGTVAPAPDLESGAARNNP